VFNVHWENVGCMFPLESVSYVACGMWVYMLPFEPETTKVRSNV